MPRGWINLVGFRSLGSAREEIIFFQQNFDLSVCVSMRASDWELKQQQQQQQQQIEFLLLFSFVDYRTYGQLFAQSRIDVRISLHTYMHSHTHLSFGFLPQLVRKDLKYFTLRSQLGVDNGSWICGHSCRVCTMETYYCVAMAIDRKHAKLRARVTLKLSKLGRFFAFFKMRLTKSATVLIRRIPVTSLAFCK